MKIFRRFKNNISLRIVNLLGLSIIFACLILSYNYITKELSYDKHHINADRMVRMSLQYNEDPVDGRIYGNSINDILQQVPEIEQVVKLSKVNTAILDYQGKKQVINDFYFASPDFFDAFSVSLLKGEKDQVLQSTDQAVISESLARQLFGENLDHELKLEGIRIGGRQVEENTFFISGIFKDIPETSHFHTDVLLYRSDKQEGFDYVYLLLKEQANIPELTQKISQIIAQKASDVNDPLKTSVLLMPLTDIHLHSHMLREMEPNGSINYIYLVIGANILLLIVVLFNLWLNGSLIFAYSRRYYQILRIHGASSSIVMREEAYMSLLLGFLALIIGGFAAYYISFAAHFPLHATLLEMTLLSLCFLALIIFTSLLPVLKSLSSTLSRDTHINLMQGGLSYANVKYMLTAQYLVVMIVVILAFGIGKQMNMVKQTQVGGNDRHILVLSEQPDKVKERYALLKSELLKYPEIKSVTSSFQLPGDAIRDYITVRLANSDEKKYLPIMLVGEDFFPFFQIRPIAGKIFSPGKLDYQTEEKMLFERFEGKISDQVEEYIINRKALNILGFNSPEEAIGQTLKLEHGTVDYINQGVICGVADDFNYTGLYEASIPLLIMQRQMFLHCINVQLDPAHFQESLATFNQVWNEVNPDYPADYTFMNDVFYNVYRNELNAERLVYAFSLLCIIISNLGLIIFMAFIVKRRTKEIGIRKVIGASVHEIVRMLNMNFIRWIGLAFAIAVPIAWYIMYRWLANFAYQTSLSWWIFAVAGLAVLFLSLISVSLQSWRAATANPIDAIKTE